MSKINISKSRALAIKTIYEMFKILKANGGEMHNQDVRKKISENITFDAWDIERYEKTGYIRWESILHFYTIDCVKAGFMRKNKGVWILTKEGEEAIKLGGAGLLEEATRRYRVWAANREEIKEKENEDEIVVEPEQAHKAFLERLENDATDGLREFIIKKNPYEFQDIVAALLRAMGYHTPFISPKGKDGGIDIIAYQDPLGAKSPRIKVQVKHRPDSSVSVQDLRQLAGILNENTEIGLFVTSGKFTTEAEKFIRTQSRHIKLLDFEGFINLWQEFYNNLNDEDKNMLPLHSIYFLGTND